MNAHVCQNVTPWENLTWAMGRDARNLVIIQAFLWAKSLLTLKICSIQTVMNSNHLITFTVVGGYNLNSQHTQ